VLTGRVMMRGIYDLTQSSPEPQIGAHGMIGFTKNKVSLPGVLAAARDISSL
jgi:hypothetical protein